MATIYWSVEFLASFVETCMCCVFCGTFLEKNKSLDKNAIMICSFIVSAVVVGILNQYSLFSYVTALVSGVICVTVQWILYRKNIGITAVLVLVFMVMILVIDFVIVQAVTLALSIEAQSIVQNQNPTRIVCTILSKAIMVLSVFVIYKGNRNSQILSKKQIGLMCVVSVIIFTSDFMLMRSTLLMQDEEIAVFAIMFFVTSIILVLLLFLFVIQISENYEKDKNLSLIEMRNDMLQKSLEDTRHAFNLWRKSVHDYKYHIIYLTRLCNEGRFYEIKEYLDSESRLTDSKMFYIETGDSVVDTIVNTKQSLADEKGIMFIVNASVPKECKIKQMDMASILGNLLDNAINACVDVNTKPYVDVKIKQEKNFILIRIANSFSGELPVNMKSTKRDKTFHGIGIKSVKSIVKKYSGEYEMTYENGEVVTRILLLNEE